MVEILRNKINIAEFICKKYELKYIVEDSILKILFDSKFDNKECTLLSDDMYSDIIKESKVVFNFYDNRVDREIGKKTFIKNVDNLPLEKSYSLSIFENLKFE